MNPFFQRVKKHSFLLLFSGLCLMCLGVIGYFALYSSTLFSELSQSIHHNASYLVVWRCSLYAVVFFSWPSICRFLESAQAKKNAARNKHTKTIETEQFKKLVALRYRLIAMAVLYEIFFVQDFMQGFK